MSSPAGLSHEEKRVPRRGGRWRWRLLMVLIVLLIGGWAGSTLLGDHIGKRISDGLESEGWTLQHESRRWSPWRGMRLTGVKIGRTGQAPLVETDNLEFHFPVSAWLGGSREGTKLIARRTPVVLRDSDGEVQLDGLSVDLESQQGEIIVHQVTAMKDGLEVRASGKVLLASGPVNVSTWDADFGAVRAVLAVLKVEPGEEGFRVDGDFTVDAREGPVTWSADFHGEGGEITWQKIPLEGATATAKLTEGKSTIDADLVLPRGKASFEFHGEDWRETPLVFAGAIEDQAARRDTFEGSYQRGKRVWTLDRLEGSADLRSLAEDIPTVANEMPEDVTFKRFPGIVVEDLVIAREGPWTLGKLELDGSGEATVKVDGRLVELSDLSGRASFDGERWNIRNAEASTLGGELRVSGSYRENRLSKAKITGADLKLSAIKALSGREGRRVGILAFDFGGEIDLKAGAARGKGSMRLDDAPVIDVPLLDPTYDLFTSMVPGIQRSKRGTFEAEFTANAETVQVHHFLATGGNLTVSAKGSVDLDKRRVDGVARGKLTGLPGLVTKPLSRLLEMEVGGPFDDIRVKPLGPAKLASNTASAMVGVAVDTLEEAGKITGTVLKEGIKAPFRWLDRDADREDEATKE